MIAPEPVVPLPYAPFDVPLALAVGLRRSGARAARRTRSVVPRCALLGVRPRAPHVVREAAGARQRITWRVTATGGRAGGEGRAVSGAARGTGAPTAVASPVQASPGGGAGAGAGSLSSTGVPPRPAAATRERTRAADPERGLTGAPVVIVWRRRSRREASSRVMGVGGAGLAPAMFARALASTRAQLATPSGFATRGASAALLAPLRDGVSRGSAVRDPAYALAPRPSAHPSRREAPIARQPARNVERDPVYRSARPVDVETAGAHATGAPVAGAESIMLPERRARRAPAASEIERLISEQVARAVERRPVPAPAPAVETRPRPTQQPPDDGIVERLVPLVVGRIRALAREERFRVGHIQSAVR